MAFPVRCVTLLLAACLAVPAAARAPVVEAPAGAVRGKTEDGVNIFRGLPFAQPPIGELRWRPPAELPRLARRARRHPLRPVCFQPARRGASIYAEELGPMSEDCLSLNIWAPAHAENAPVFVWIHGGALTAGRQPPDDVRRRRDGPAGHDRRLDQLPARRARLSRPSRPQRRIARRRLGQLRPARPDRRAALGQPQHRARSAAIPRNVTIAGESAGALSVMYLMAAPQARGLFAKAIVQSAYMVSAPELRRRASARPRPRRSAPGSLGQLGAADLADLRAMDPQELTEAAVARRLFSRAARSTAASCPPARRHLRPRRAGAGADPRRLQQRRDPLAALPRCRRRPPTRRPMRRRSARLWRSRRSNSCASIRPAISRESMLAAAARRALRLDRRAAGAQADGARPGRPSSIISTTAIRPPTTPACTPSMPPKCPICSARIGRPRRPGRRCRDTPAETSCPDAMLGLLGQLRAQRPADAPRVSPPGSPMATSRAYMAFAGAPRPRRRSPARHVRAARAGRLPPPRAGGIPWNWNVGIVAPPLPAGAPECR